MLQQLKINQFILINQANLTFSPGMTSITGETGSGKSLLIQAIELCLGKKVEKHQLDKIADKIDIELIFQLKSDHLIFSQLAALELTAEEDCLVLRRVIQKEGKSRYLVNGYHANAKIIKTLAGQLINIHGQHDNQSLLSPEVQLAIVDSFGELQAEARQVSSLAQDWRKTAHTLTTLRQQSGDDDKKALLTYQLQELEDIPSLSDYRQLEKEHNELTHAEDILATCQKAATGLENESPGIRCQLHSIAQALASQSQHHTGLTTITQSLEEADVHLKAAQEDIFQIIQTLAIDEERVQLLDTRFQTLFDLGRKHQKKPWELTEHREALQAALAELVSHEETFQQLSDHLDTLEKQYHDKATALSKLRQVCVTKLNKQVSAQLKKLDIKGKFVATLLPTASKTPNAFGHEQMAFLVQTNPDRPPLPLNKIASGGELSRISLALQSIISKKYAFATLIFDEVDVGISGQAAEVVGNLLHQIGHNTQTLCITHLPQVASQGDHHLRVSKSIEKGQTHTLFDWIEGHERVQEVARMMGGKTVSDHVLAHAKELLADR